MAAVMVLALDQTLFQIVLTRSEGPEAPEAAEEPEMRRLRSVRVPEEAEER